MIMEKIGVVCGRFQIFHNEHLQYVMAAKEKCEHLIVGITSPDPSVSPVEKADVSRSSDVANPCTYYERMKMIEAALFEQGLRREEFDLVPYPIGCPELVKYYIPQNACHFITILDEWGDCKKERIEKWGYKVHVLWKKTEKGISSTMLRQCMVEGKPWKQYVPNATYEYIIANEIDKRIIEMMK